MLGYAILAIELEDLDAAAQLLAIIEPYAGQIATNLGPAAAYAGRYDHALATGFSSGYLVSAGALALAAASRWP
jgi:hypothetical protein